MKYLNVQIMHITFWWNIRRVLPISSTGELFCSPGETIELQPLNEVFLMDYHVPMEHSLSESVS